MPGFSPACVWSAGWRLAAAFLPAEDLNAALALLGSGRKSGSKLPHSKSASVIDLAFMQIREYQESDLAALRAIHASQGFEYALPDLRNPLFVTKLVLFDENIAPPFRAASVPLNELRDTGLKPGATKERILGAAFLRLTAEAYLLLDPRAGTPRERWQWLLALHAAAERDAWQRGLEDVHAWLPPPIAKKFGKRVERLGWLRDDAWTPYCKKLTEGK